MRVRYLLLPIGLIVVCAASTTAHNYMVRWFPMESRFFRTSDACQSCHNTMIDSAGRDISIGVEWRASIMANAARDPYWHAAVRREIIDHPSRREHIEDSCSRCHMPMANEEWRAQGDSGQIFVHLPIGKDATEGDRFAADGVSCTVCHQIQPDNLGSRESWTGEFIIDRTTPDDQRAIFGPFVIDSGRTRVMHSASRFIPTEATHLKQSELCATCHQLYTQPFDRNDRPIDIQFPEQVPYFEWYHSAYRGNRTCQDCHMFPQPDSTPITSVLPQRRPEVNRHVFTGGNFFMLRMLNRYRGELGVTAMPQELNASAERTENFLRTETARIIVERTSLANDRLDATVFIRNLTGHKFPTAYPSRRAWVHLTVRDRNGNTVFESGALRRDGSIVGNNNDDNQAQFEPHRDVIDSPEQVVIYESIMVAPDGHVTTGLLTGVRYAKDNRLLPDGFDKHAVPSDIQVYGNARQDANFIAGSDRVRYTVRVNPANGPFRIDAKLWYQPISFRWAHNLEPYASFETQRFLRYYKSMSEVSGIVVAETTTTVER